MTDKNQSIILEIQKEAIETNVDVTALLRKAKLAATKLKQEKALAWMNQELNGYDCSFDELPTYRQMHGQLKVHNPYHGLVSFILQDPKTEELLTRAPLADGVGTLQELVKRNSETSLQYQMSAGHRNALIGLMSVKLEPILLVSDTPIKNALSKVVTMVLEWALELEAAGVVGEGLSFSMNEKNSAASATQNIFAQNIGQIGNPSENSSVSVSQNSSGNQQINVGKLEEFVRQAREAAHLLPQELVQATESLLDEIENAPIEEKRVKLVNLRSVLEGAAGNLTAQGIIQLISGLL